MQAYVTLGSELNLWGVDGGFATGFMLFRVAFYPMFFEIN
jgi:hypothetical protein